MYWSFISKPKYCYAYRARCCLLLVCSRFSNTCIYFLKYFTLWCWSFHSFVAKQSQETLEGSVLPIWPAWDAQSMLGTPVQPPQHTHTSITEHVCVCVREGGETAGHCVLISSLSPELQLPLSLEHCCRQGCQALFLTTGSRLKIISELMSFLPASVTPRKREK